MIKILFAIGRLSVGGGEKLLVRQLQHIDRQKFDPYLLTLFPEQKDSFEEMLYATVSEGAQFFETRWKKMKFRGLFDAVSWFQLIRFLRKEKFDAVATSLFSANLIVRFALLCAGAPAALVSYEHNIYADKHRWQIIADRFLARWTQKIIVDSEIVKRFTAEQERIPIDKFLTL
ncbi:glycosyltransferase, partial [Patescibacteria group bacterium]|nr:glycosyltransferase [Patescibacteria group bacterium]